MKNLLLVIALMASTTIAFAQACDVKIDNKSYTVKFIVNEPTALPQPGVGTSISYTIEIKNNSKIKLDFEAGLWGEKADGSKNASLSKSNKKTAGPGSSITIPGTFKAMSIDEIKLTVTKTDCMEAGKNTYKDPSFYKKAK